MSAKIGVERQQHEFALSFSALFRIEAQGAIPSFYQLHSLSVIYHRQMRELLEWFGVNLEDIPANWNQSGIPITHVIDSSSKPGVADALLTGALAGPAKGSMTCLVDGRKLASIMHVTPTRMCVYAYVGTKDYTMFPLIVPGSLLEVDESRSKVVSGGWHSEHERPVYLVETRSDGFRVGWCSLAGRVLTVYPYTLSPTSVVSYSFPRDAEIVGQVVAVCMRLPGCKPASGENESKRQLSKLRA
jgi:hypothetical protein